MSDDTWQRGIEDLANGAFWEAHEAWEDLWQALPMSSAREATQALIQFAATCYKVQQVQQGRDADAMQTGMERLLELGRGHLEEAAELGPPETTWEHEHLRHGFDQLEEVLAAWRNGAPLDEVVERIEETADELAETLQSYDRGVE